MRPNLWIVPGSPALALSPSDAASLRLLQTVRELAGTADGRAIDIVSSRDRRWYTAHTGSFTAWGRPDVTVRGGNYLGELVARFVLGDPVIREARDSIGTPDPNAVTVVVLDGPAGLTPRAPLALVDGAPEYHQQVLDWLDGAQPEVVDKLLLEPALWHELAGLRPHEAELIDHDDTLGVGRYVAQWCV